MLTAIKVAIATLLPALLAAACIIVGKTEKVKKLKYWQKQCIIGVLYGLIAVYSSENGIDVGGAMINVRDAAPLTAGLVFGAPAGIIAGLVGGLERWFAVYWGGGTYTRLACSLATIAAGFYAALLRKFMFENKRPSFFAGLIIGITTEVLHMLMIFLTNMNDIYTAFTFVERCALTMISLCGLAVMLSLITVTLMSKGKFKQPRGEKQLAQTFSVFLMVCVVTAFVVTSVFTGYLQASIADTSTKLLLELNVDDVQAQLQNNAGGIQAVAQNRHVGRSGFIIVTDKNGLIVSDSQGHLGETLTLPQDGALADGEVFLANVYEQAAYCMYSEAGNYCIISVLPEDEAEFSRDIAVYVTVFMEVIVYAALFITEFFLIRNLIVENIHKVNRSLAKITGGDLNETVKVLGNEEFTSLSHDINATVSVLKRYIAEAEARIDKELEFAKQIQYSVLPTQLPMPTEELTFDLFADMYTAKEVGGDFYDFYLINPHTLIFMIADVSGKGIPAAMFMMTAKTMLKSLAESGKPIEEVFAMANDKLCENNEAEMFVTAWLGSLDLRTGLLTFVNAGHNPPVICRKGAAPQYLDEKTNFILAGMEGFPYGKDQLQLQPGDEIFLYTDGVTEATDTKNELYGEDRLLQTLTNVGNRSAKEQCIAVKKDIDAFVGTAPQFDDITMLALRLDFLVEQSDGTDGEKLADLQDKPIFIETFNAPPVEQGEDSYSTAPTEASLQPVAAFLDSLIDQWRIPFDAAAKIMVAADEMYSNIVRYSGADSATVKCSVQDGLFTLCFTDNGTPFDPTATLEPDVTLPAEEREIGGLGIFMVKNSVSSMSYKYVENNNLLTLTFSLSDSD